MANICGNYLTITTDGDGSSLDALYARLLKQDKKLIATVPNFEIIPNSDYAIYDKDCIVQEEDGDITISFSSKWSPPIDEIAELSSEYSDLVFHLVYEEGGNDSYGEIQFNDGGYTENEMSCHDYHAKYHEDYKAALNRIKFSTYKSFVKNYSHGGFEEYPYSMLDTIVEKRIKDADLPLFVNREWMDSDAERRFKHRLAGGSIE